MPHLQFHTRDKHIRKGNESNIQYQLIAFGGCSNLVSTKQLRIIQMSSDSVWDKYARLQASLSSGANHSGRAGYQIVLQAAHNLISSYNSHSSMGTMGPLMYIDSISPEAVFLFC